MKTAVLVLLCLAVLALATPLTREKVECAKKAFDRHYTSHHPYSNYITSASINEENGEFVIFVTLWQQPPASLTLPHSYRGVKVIYHLEAVVCTMEAKLCPDGSYVGREGPKCEFALCPGEIANNGTSIRHHNGVARYRLAMFVLTVTISSAVMFSLCLCCCVAIARRRRCARYGQTECDLETLSSSIETGETRPEETTVVTQTQPQPVYYYAPYPQAPAVNQAPYGAYSYMMPMQPPMVPQQAVFQPMSDEEYARQLQAQFNAQH